MTTKKYGGGKRALAGVAVGGLIVAGVGFAAAAPASADTFKPANSVPTASIDSATLSFSPDQDSSSDVYTISSTITDLNSLADLDSVSLCLSRVDVGDPTCADTNHDPQDTVFLEWKQATDTYTIDAAPGGVDDSSHYSLGNGTEAAPDYSEVSTDLADYSFSGYSPTNTAMAPKFTLRVSEAMREGNWLATLRATDGEAIATVTQSHTVGFYGSIDVPRVTQHYGDIDAGSSAAVDDTSAGTIVVNGPTDVTYSIGAAFTDGSVTAAIDAGAFGSAVTTGRAVGIDCDPNATYNSNNQVGGAPAEHVRLSLNAQDCEQAVLLDGTPEGGVTSVTQSTAIHHGGELPRLGPNYSATVTVGVTADAE